jgi:adenylate cyclase class 2
MREIEIKVRLSRPEPILAALERAGVQLSKPIRQHDVVYGRKKADGTFVHGSNWLRVRTENEQRVILTLKRSVTGNLDSIEHETAVESEAEITAIIQALGYELYSDITKVRRHGHSGGITLCYDEVPELGTFLEAELLSPEDADYERVAARLWQFVETLGVSKANQVTAGYDILLRRQQGAPE